MLILTAWTQYQRDVVAFWISIVPVAGIIALIVMAGLRQMSRNR